MAVVKFKKKEPLKILFGIRLPEIVSKLCNEFHNKKKVYEIIRNTYNINEKRLINLVDVVDSKKNDLTLLIIYDNFLSESQKLKEDLEIKVFDFDIFEFDINKSVDIEMVIKVKKEL